MVNSLIMILPLDKKLRKRMHRKIALVQDILVMEVYNNFPKAVIRGGTALWRCYGSNRFSEDLDFYLPLNLKQEKFENFLNGLKQKGFGIEKFKRTENSIFSKFSYLEATVRFEAVLKNVKNFVTKNFEMSDGTFILVNTLTPENMLEEKILTYMERRRVKDLYDIFFLLKICRKENVKDNVRKLMEEFKKPIDEKELKVLIISGSIPSVEEMLRVVRIWAK